MTTMTQQSTAIATTNSVTYTPTYGDSYSLPIAYRNWRREPGCVDLILTRAAAIDLPLQVQIQIRTDGSVVLASCDWGQSQNTCWHVAQGATKVVDGEEVNLPLTPAQERTIALIWANRSELIERVDPLIPRALLRAVGATPQRRLSRSVVEILRDLDLPIPPLA